MDMEKFETLTPEEQARIFHHSTFRERVDLIRHSHQPRALIQSLSHEELYLLTKEMDIEERSEVIKYATLPQLYFVTDVDCWKKDRIDGDSFMEWLETLKAANEKVLLNWLLSMDYESVVTGFQKVIKVLKPEWEFAADELLGDTPYFTIDQMYYVSVGEENLEIVRRALQILFENHRGRYISLLEGVMAEVEDQIEEEAYLNRENRLAERGFPDYETARKIYRPITKEEFLDFPPKKSALIKETAQLPNYPVLWASERLFLDDVLLHISKGEDEFLENLHEELTWVSNKVLACLGIDFSSEDKVKRGIERARFFVSIGLEDLSNGEINKAEEILSQRWCENIFRWGFSRVHALKERTEAVLKSCWKGHKIPFFDFLPPPYDKIAQGILLGVPQYYESAAPGQPDGHREFKTLAEVERTAISIAQIEKIHSLLVPNYPAVFMLFNESLEEKEVELSGTAVLGTLFARYVLGEKIEPKAFSFKRAVEFAQKVFEMKGSRRVIRPDLREDFLNHFHGEDARFMTVFWSFVFQEIEDQMSSIDWTAQVDMKFIHCLMIHPEAAPKPAGRRKNV